MLCKIDTCTQPQLEGRPFCCKKHWNKLPRKIKTELNKLYDDGKGSITVIALERLTIKANFAIKLPSTWEKRAAFYLKKLKKQVKKERILIVTGDVTRTNKNRGLWKILNKLIVRAGIENESAVRTNFNSEPHSIAVVLGVEGFKQTLPPYKVKNGIVHMQNQIVTPEDYINAAWATRPNKGTRLGNTYMISCEPHPEEYDEFGEDEITEIKFCLAWAAKLYKSKMKVGI